MLRREIYNIIIEILSDKLVIIAYVGFLIILFLLRTILFPQKRQQKLLSHLSKSDSTSGSILDKKEGINSEEKKISNEGLIETTRSSSEKKN